ncbi:antiviral RADAR system adenosine triphosphatase RdrA [Undibacterium crateris]|uniref:antiviral RADAR system adenosine triphosphatase RdrA n=1 Tax=Undibacterium crateris TaxID=2528175 RepID=UPI0013899981|nr:antiviral RADAR system adenosine triphosphatase RdrA [Undibacterium crateris]NDI83997.1 hypothetical protein [Undibacterium crateris]
MSDNKENIIYFPVDQGEQARQPKAENLLARDVYKRIADLLERSDKKLNGKLDVELDDLRAHEAILIDGGRGTGKSSILVNLPLYLNQEPELKDKLLILKPVDPTLLEDGDDLFLNIIVAALLRDKQIKDALSRVDHKTEAFYEQLQRLGTALEGVQKQKNEFGLDKLRAFIGNHGIADEVHKLFGLALGVTNKRLIVLPIDDVDTSLQHAFENLEVVRKYLASPYVVPIISGDLNLYRDVTWREFYGRITDKVKDHAEGVRRTANELAIEYQRKVLPLPRRVNVPDVMEYLCKKDILLIKGDKKLLSFADMYDLLILILNGAVNGRDNSYLELPVSSVRELSQLIISIGGNLADLAPHLSRNKRSTDAVENDEDKLNGVDKNPYFDQILNQRTVNSEFDKLLSQLIGKLAAYFSIHDRAGAAYLVVQADQYWYRIWGGSKKESKNKSEGQPPEQKTACQNPLNIPLFAPLSHSAHQFSMFEKEDGLKENWNQQLKEIVRNPKWLRELPEQTVLPYPNLDLGAQVHRQLAWPVKSTDQELKRDHSEYFDELLRQLLIHEGSYSIGNDAVLVQIGRIFELLIASLTQDLTADYVKDLLQRPPFYSASALSLNTTGAFLVTEFGSKKDATETSDLVENDKKSEKIRFEKSIDSFVEEINIWREGQKLDQFRLSPWLVYCVFHKLFTRAASGDSSREKASSEKKNLSPLYRVKYDLESGQLNYSPNGHLPKFNYVIDVGIRAFNAICADFGSFEKGSFSGQHKKISDNEVGTAWNNFHKASLFTQNISPFLENVNFSNDSDFSNTKSKLGAVVGKLYLHPLGQMLKKSLREKEVVVIDQPLKSLRVLSQDEISKDEIAMNNLLRSEIDGVLLQFVGENFNERLKILSEQPKNIKDKVKTSFLRGLSTTLQRYLKGYLVSKSGIHGSSHLARFIKAIELVPSDLNA